MSKQLFVDPVELRQKGEVTFVPIPVNQYSKSISEELAQNNFTAEDLKRIYRDMFIIRELRADITALSTTTRARHTSLWVRRLPL